MCSAERCHNGSARGVARGDPLFARLESPAELDFATHGVCSCKRYTRASAHNVARGYDDRAATTAALMCLLPEPSTRAPKNRGRRKSLVGTLRAQTRRPRRVACAVGGRMGERQPAKHHSSLASQASSFGTEGVLLERFFPRGWPWARADTGRSAAIWQAGGGSVPPCSVLSPPWAAFEPLF